MGMTHDPDETAVLDLAVAQRKIVALFQRDGVVDTEEQRTLIVLDQARQRLSLSYRRRRWFEAFQRNGDNAYTRRLARGADITFVADGAVVSELTTLVPARNNERPHRGHDGDVA